jgi:hypothetical protein
VIGNSTLATRLNATLTAFSPAWSFPNAGPFRPERSRSRQTIAKPREVALNLIRTYLGIAPREFGGAGELVDDFLSLFGK